jgi:hypothetical protein
MRLRWVAPAALLVVSACGGTPEETEKARGVLGGVPLVLAMSVLFIVGALLIVGGAVALDRMVRSRRRLDDAQPESEEEEKDEVVAGITVGRAPVPRWLYAAYVLIPIFAFAYVFSNVAVKPASAEKTPAPAPSGPCTKCEIIAQGIKFDKDKLEVAGGKPVSVAFDNKDSGIPHTFTVWKTEADATGGGKPVADTGAFAGVATKNVTFTAPPAGTTWYFDCTVHPAMKGDLVAAAG